MSLKLNYTTTQAQLEVITKKSICWFAFPAWKFAKIMALCCLLWRSEVSLFKNCISDGSWSKSPTKSRMSGAVAVIESNFAIEKIYGKWLKTQTQGSPCNWNQKISYLLDAKSHKIKKAHHPYSWQSGLVLIFLFRSQPNSSHHSKQ